MVNKLLFLLLITLLILPLFALAHEAGEATGVTNNYNQRAGMIALYATIILIVLCFLSLTHQKSSNTIKAIFYILICIITLATTIYLAGSTLYLNFTSSTGGPVHYHTDFELWNCGEKLSLKEPEGMSNRIGTSTLHEHNDNRIHVEGVIYDEEDANLAHLFDSVGGYITQEEISIPTDKGMLTRRNGDLCPDGTAGTLQAYLYRVDNPKVKLLTYHQEKLNDITNYTPAPEELVPPGDCLIITFGPITATTPYMCETYHQEEQEGNIHGR